jgi:hypothetical protein
MLTLTVYSPTNLDMTYFAAEDLSEITRAVLSDCWGRIIDALFMDSAITKLGKRSNVAVSAPGTSSPANPAPHTSKEYAPPSKSLWDYDPEKS